MTITNADLLVSELRVGTEEKQPECPVFKDDVTTEQGNDEKDEDGIYEETKESKLSQIENTSVFQFRSNGSEQLTFGSGFDIGLQKLAEVQTS